MYSSVCTTDAVGTVTTVVPGSPGARWCCRVNKHAGATQCVIVPGEALLTLGGAVTMHTGTVRFQVYVGHGSAWVQGTGVVVGAPLYRKPTQQSSNH